MKEEDKLNEIKKGEGESAGELIGIMIAIAVLLLVAVNYLLPIMIETAGILGTGSTGINVLNIIKVLGVMILLFILPFVTLKVGSILGKKADDRRN